MIVDLKDAHGKYEANKVAKAIEKYNLEIYTTIGTIDTSLYNISSILQGTEIDNKISDQQGDLIAFAYNPKGAIKIQGPDNITDFGASKHKIIQIPIRTITKIVVKSYRDFLGNQGPAKQFT